MDVLGVFIKYTIVVNGPPIIGDVWCHVFSRLSPIPCVAHAIGRQLRE